MKSAFNDFTIETREFSIIGCFLTWPEKIEYINKLDDWMFTIKIAKEIFIAMRYLNTNGRTIGLTELKLYFSEQSLGYKSEHEMFLKKAIDAAYPITIEDINSFVESSQLRKIRNDLIFLQKELQDGKHSYNSIVQQLDKSIAEAGHYAQNVQEFIPGTFLTNRGKILKRREESKQIFLGKKSLDNLIPGGMRKKEISIIASRSGIGKSSFKANLIADQCQLGFKIASIATEQTEEVETDRIDCIMTEINIIDIINSKEWGVDDPRIQQIKDTNKYIDENWNYFLLVKRKLTTEGSIAWLRKIINKYGKLDAVYYDLFDRLEDVSVERNKAQVVTSRLSYMSQAAEELDFHLCLLVQISREVKLDKSRGYRPRLWHLKDSGGYEEVARLVMLLHRESYYNPEVLDNVLEVNIAKQSNGPAGDSVTAHLGFDQDTLKINDNVMSKPKIFE